MATISNLLTYYLGSGSAAARPDGSQFGAGCTGWYFASDTCQLFAWNGTGWKQVPLFSDLAFPVLAPAAISASGSTTLTAAQLVGGAITRSGPTAAVTDTTDSAANLLAAIPNSVIGQAFRCRYKNTTNFPVTLSAGTGVTIIGASIIQPAGSIEILGYVTATGTPAVTLMVIASIAENVAANQVLAGPASGGATGPGFRALVAADIAAAMVTKQAVGDANLTINAVTTAVISTAALTANRTWSLPAANAVPAGSALMLKDAFQAVGTYTITIAPAGSDTIEDGTVSPIFNNAGTWLRLISDGISNWSVTGRSPKLTIFLSSGTFTPEPGAQSMEAWAMGGGGGGGGGALQATGLACSGGGGGGGANLQHAVFAQGIITGAQTVTIGAGTTGGLPATVNSTAGGDNTAFPGQTYFPNYNGPGGIFAPGASGGTGGKLAANSAGGNGSSPNGNGSGAGGGNGANGGAGSAIAGGGGGGGVNGAAGANGGAGYDTGNGGGAGGGISTANAYFSGGLGPGANQLFGRSPGNAAGGTTGVNGTNGIAPLAGAPFYATGSGGGGGGSHATAAGNGGNGGLGSGGGGGGSARNGGVAGHGGNGGNGFVIFLERF